MFPNQEYNIEYNLEQKLLGHFMVIGGMYFTSMIGLGIISIVLSMIFGFFILGNLIRNAFNLIYDKHSGRFGFLVTLSLDILMSSIIFTGTCLLFASLFLLTLVIPILSVGAVSIGLFIYFKSKKAFSSSSSRTITFDRMKIISIAICILVAFTFIIYRLSLLHWPATTGSDLQYHLTAVNFLLENNGGSFLFDSYPYRFHPTIAAMAIISKVEPSFIFRQAPVIIYPIALLFIYHLLETLTQNKTISIVASSIFPLVNEAGVLLGPQYLYTSTYAFLIYCLTIIALVNNNNNRMVKVTTAIAYLVLLVLYPYAILGTIPAILYFFYKNRKISEYIIDLIWIGILLGLVFFTSYYFILPLIGIQPFELNFGIGFLRLTNNLTLQVAIFSRAYHWLFILFLLGGIMVLALLSHNKISFVQVNNSTIILSILCLYLLAFFLPVATAARVDLYIRPFIMLAIVIGAYTISKAFVSILNINFTRPTLNKKRTISLLMILMLAIPTIASVQAISETVRWDLQGPRQDEMDAFQWLDSRVSGDDYVLTDPATGLMLRAQILTSASYYFINDERFYTQPLRPQIFNFFNESAWEEDEYYDNIASTTNGIDYILISPRTTDWVWHAQENIKIKTALYVGRYGLERESWAKFFTPKYTVEAKFGAVYILSKNNVSIYYNETFNEDSQWFDNEGMLEPSNEQIALEKGSHESAWYNVFTNIMSFKNVNNIYLEAKIRTNTTNLECRLFGYEFDLLEGQRIFQSDYTYPLTSWRLYSWNITEIMIERNTPFESLSFSFFNSENNWIVFIDDVKIYGARELDYIPIQEEFTVYQEEFEVNSTWYTNEGGDPIIENGTCILKNSANPDYWYHLFTNNISMESLQGMFLTVKYKCNTSGLGVRAFGFHNDNISGGYSFYTDYLPLKSQWIVQTWNLTNTPGTADGSFESLSFGFLSMTKNWIFILDSVQIYRVL
ncbi:MAG: membrane protein of unknown function [Candidatus Thorarchaeota archaeon]|nr:MAG: membrane protein of unknown function [Candidatus Thorarchaeota archaeon]